MKTINVKKTWISILILSLVMMSCNKDYLAGVIGYGDIVTQSLVLENFTGFVNSISADIYITQGEEPEVVIEAQQNIIDNIEQDRVENGFWKIKYDRWVRRADKVKIYITMPYLDKVVISGSGKVTGETIFTDLDDLDLVISGSGSIYLDFESENLDITISGSGDMDLSGVTPTIDATISGSGNVRAFDLESDSVECVISGSGDTRLSVSEYLKAVISGSGSVIYRGIPEINVRISGSGNVTRDQ